MHTLIGSDILPLSCRIKQQDKLQGARPRTMAGTKQKAMSNLPKNPNAANNRILAGTFPEQKSWREEEIRKHLKHD